MEQNYNSGASSHSSVNVHGFSFLKSKIKLLFALFFIFLGFTNNLYSQIAQRGTATTATASNSGTITIAKPTGVVTGDLMILNIAYSDASNLGGINASLAGWTLISGNQLSSNRRRGCVLYKIATATEPANYTFIVPAGTDFIVGGILAYSGIDNANPFDVAPGTLNVNGGSTTATAISITTVTANTQIIMLAMADLGAVTFNAPWNTTSPGALTELYDVSNSSPAIGAASLSKPTIGATGNGTITISSSQGNAGILLALRPAIPPPANDICSGALLLTSNTTCTTTTGSTTGATDNNETGDCTTGIENAVWYEFQAVATNHVVTVDGIANFDAVIQVISACGSATSPTGGACVDATADNGIETLTLSGLTVGSFYKIQIHDYNGDLTTNAFTVCVTHTSPPTITSLGAVSGCVGSSLVITGTNLTGATAVTIGGTPATITGNTATTVTVTVGTGTTGTVQVTNPNGTATSAATFTVNPLPAAIAGGAATVCTGASTPAFTNATPGGTWSTSNANAAINGLGVLTGVTAGTVRVIYTLPTGCFVQTALINVEQTPGAIAGGAATVCNGASTPAFTNPNGGGTWSVLAGSGTATITGGGVLTGTSSGTVTVRYTIGTCTPATFNVNIIASPAAIAGGAATVCIGGTTPAFTNAAGGGTWSITNGSGSATISIGGVVTGVTAGTATVVYSIGTCTTSTPITVITTPTTVVGPTPANAATGVCFTGAGAVTSISWAASASATSYDVYFGAGSLPGSLTANVATNSYTTGALAASTTYFWRVVARNSCGDAVTSATFTFTTAALSCDPLVYCVPTSTNDTYPISNVTFAGINNNSSALVTAGPDYQDFSGISGNVTAGSTYNISVTSTGAGGTNTFYQYVFFDWNNNGNFADDGGPYNLGNYTTATATFNLNITIPLTATIGTIRFRVVNSFNSILSPCTTTGFFQMEDYSLNIVAPPACIAPTAVPTALILSAGTPAGTAINGSFTAAAPAPNSYLVVVSTSNVAPTIANGTTYTIGGNAGVGYTVVDTDTNTTFTSGGLNPSTTYYFYVYSMNNVCSGGPLYNPTPLIGNLTTGATLPSYCNATTLTGQATRYIDDISFLGMLNGNILNLNTGFTTLPAPGGYQNWTGLATKPIQAQGGGVNISFEGNSRGTWKAWVDWNKDGDFTDAGELVYTSAGVAMITNTFGFIVPAGATPGDYRVRIRTYNAFGNYNATGGTCDDPAYEYYGDGANHFDSCTQLTSYSQFINNGCGGATVNFTEYGETEDYLFTVVEMCLANIVTVNDGEICGPGAVNVSVTGTAGTTQYRWYSAETGGALLASTGTGSWTTPVIAATTSYWVTAFNGSCESLVRTEVIAKISPLPTITFTPSVPEVCGENNIVSITAGGDTELVYLIDEDFETGGLGVFTNTFLAANNAQTAWQNRTSTFIPTGSTWYPAISSNFGTNRFAFVTSDTGGGIIVDNVLTSPSVATTNFIDLTLNFRMYYSRYFPDGNATYHPIEFMQVQVSNNGGAWTTLGGNIITDQGIGTRFADLSYDLSAYTNTNIRIRIRYFADAWCDGAAVDNIQLFGTRPLSTSFQWTSVLPVDAYLDPAAITTPYTVGTPAVTVYIRPTMAQLEQTTYSFTATAVLNNGCSASSLVSIDNKSKVWKGGTDGDWNNANNWLPIGVPDASTCVIIPPAPNTSNVIGTNYNGFGKTLQVINGGSLTINPTNTVTITDFVEVRGPASVFNIENSGSLIQVNNVPNIGNITYRRTANIRRQDYVYWSSPVSGFSNSAISPGTSLGFQYKWLPTTGGINNFGNWTYANEAMINGKGYIVRGPDAFSTSVLTNYTAAFTGVPNNGNITVPISRGTYDGVNYSTGVSPTPGTKDDDNWNLVGNPYPSAINAIDFLTLNTNITGFVNIWTHGTLPSNAIADPFYNNFVYNYTPSDYITYNSTGDSSGPGVFNGLINAGQGFFVSMLHTSAAATENLTFNNTLRNNTYSNNVFYKTSNDKDANTEELEKHRIWFDIVTPNGTNVRSMLGYAENATNEKDRLFDAFCNDKSSFNIYSMIDEELMIIQGRKLPFDPNDKVKIGVSIPQDGLYKIALSAVDGLFLDKNQNIYLEDKVLNIIYNLKEAPYSFIANKGHIKNRFVLRFSKDINEKTIELKNQVIVYDNEILTVQSGKLKIKNIQVFDVLGKQLLDKNNVDNSVYEIKNLTRSNSLIIVKVTLEDNSEETRKVIY